MNAISRFLPYVCIIAVAAMYPFDANYAPYVWGGGLTLVIIASLLQVRDHQLRRAETAELQQLINNMLERRDLTLRCTSSENLGVLFNH
jgi:hypothetical protein